MQLHRPLFPLWVLAGIAIPFGLGYAIDGTLGGALTAALWGGAVRIFLLHHVTWSINTVCHFFGTRRFAVDDHSTNVFWLAVLSMGESWHHNHHAFPRSAAHGLRWWEVDVDRLGDPRDARAPPRVERGRDPTGAPARLACPPNRGRAPEDDGIARRRSCVAAARLVIAPPREAAARPPRHRDGPPHRARHPAHHREELHGARLRLRADVRRGQPLRDRRHLRDRARRALEVLRPDAGYAFRGNGTSANNLDSDFFYKRIIAQGTIEKLIAQKPPAGPVPADQAGHPRLRARLQRLPAHDRRRQDPRPDLPRRGVGAPDQGDRRLPPLLPAGAAGLGRAWRSTASAAPHPRPTSAAPSAPPRTDARRTSIPAASTSCSAASARTPSRSASRARARAAACCSATRTSRGTAPSASTSRTSRSPGKVDVQGGSLFGVPIILIGNTRSMAWSHTVSTARRFTPYELKLAPGDQHAYLVDGQVEEMTPTDVTVDAAATARRPRARSTTRAGARCSPASSVCRSSRGRRRPATRSATPTRRTSATSTTSSSPTRRSRSSSSTRSRSATSASRG